MASKSIRIKSWKKSLSDAVDAMENIKAGKEANKRSPTRKFHDLKTARSILTDDRLALLKLIRHSKPNSIAMLARLAKRDLKAVNSDVELLKGLGLVKATETTKGKANSLRTDTTEIVFRIAV